jgi:ATP/maltotriose-dependent transcriptional regulator MalT
VERTPIIRSKLAFPSLRGQLVERTRLDRRLEHLISRFPVVCVVATAGAGKTTAVVQATRRLDLPVAWLAVDSSETSTGRLLTYLEATLALRVPAADGVATRALGAGVQHQEAAGLLAEALGDKPGAARARRPRTPRRLP